MKIQSRINITLAVLAATIIVAVLFFGGLWGVWGVFFAIPLATLVQAVINTWPRGSRVEVEKPPA